MSVIFNDTLSSTGALLSHTSDSGHTYTPIVISATTLEGNTVSIDANGIPEASTGGGVAGVFISGLTLPSTFTIQSTFKHTGTNSGIGWFFNYDATAHTALLLNIEPASNGGQVSLYRVAYTSSNEFDFTPIASQAFTFASNTSYVLTMTYVAGVFTCSLGGTALTNLNYTDSYTVGHVAGLRMSGTATPTNGHLQALEISNTAGVTTAIYADDPNIEYIGPWAPVQGVVSSSYTFALSNTCEVWCRLSAVQSFCIANFDVSLLGAGQYSDVIIEIDGVEGTRTTLTSSGVINGAFPTVEGVNFNTYVNHFVKIKMASIFDGTAAGWTLAAGVAKFTGLTIDAGGSLLPMYSNPALVAFYGDSLTNGENMLGSSSLPTQQDACINWTKKACEMAGFNHIAYGYSGAGLVKSGLGTSFTQFGVPLFATSFGLAASGISSRTITPTFIVFGYGTNDHGQSVSQSTFQTAYLAALTAIVAAYPSAIIIPTVWPSMAAGTGPGSYAANVTAAVTALASTNCPTGNILDVSGSFISADYSDGVHLNVAGHTKMAGLVAAKIQALVTSYKLTPYGSSGSGSSGIGAADGMDIEYIYSSSSNVRKRVFIQDNSVSYRKGKTGLAYNTAGISWGYMPFGGAALVTVTPVTATLGTWVSGGFVEVGGGWYEIGLPNALVGSSEAEMFIIGMSGAADVQVRYLMRGTIQ